MKFFIDSAEIQQISDLNAVGLVDGVTTNPSIIANSGLDFKTVIADICEIVEGHVSAEVVATKADEMVVEGLHLREISDQVCVKLPLTMEGLKACHELSRQSVPTNVTLCFSANQALLAAKCGATYISPFIGRLDDISLDGIELISEIRTVFDNYDFGTQILAASIRSVNHAKACALVGADVMTAPPKVIHEMSKHVLTDKGLATFMKDWQSSGQKIL